MARPARAGAEELPMPAQSCRDPRPARLRRCAAPPLPAAPGLLLLLLLAGCGHAAAGPAPAPAPDAPALPSGPLPGAAPLPAELAGLDYHSAAVLAHDMNAAAGNPRYARIHAAPQAALDFAALPAAARGASALGGLATALPAPATLAAAAPAASAARRASFTPDDLIVTGGSFDPALPLHNVAAGSDPEFASFASATAPYQPVVTDGAYAVYRFALGGYSSSGQPQSIGTLWDDDDTPSRYFIGLSDWTTGRWEWFEGGADLVVTVASLAPYIRSGDGALLAAVCVLDSEPRQLLLLQAGALELRGFGGVPPQAPEGQDLLEPDDYYPGKAPSAVDGAPARCLLDNTLLGPAYDQGQALPRPDDILQRDLGQ
jgi:hypothetical protein